MAKKTAPVSNPFDLLASAPAATKSKSTVKVAAKVDDTVKKAVDQVIKAKAAKAAAEADQAAGETVIIGSVGPQYDSLARAGKFTKSLLVEGNTGSVTFVTSDSFSVPQTAEEQEALKELLKARFDEFFFKTRSIALTDTVQANADLINKIVKAVTDAGIPLQEAFVVKDVLKACDDMDKKQFELTPAQLEQFRALVKQKKPGLK